MYSKILEEAEALQKDLVIWRRQLHRIPEVGMSLPKTSGYVQKKLSEWHIPFEVTANGSCVTGKLGTEGPCILLRGDMDALPLKEESGEEFASENGCMHACGHDMHTTILLGAAKVLKSHESELNGQIKLLFQPGEEMMEGAKTAIREGVLTNPFVGAAFAMHVTSLAPLGMITFGKTPLSSAYGFEITLTGKGGHGSSPEVCVDPITAGVQVHLALQELVARECPFGSEVSLTIGQFNAGDAPNIIPNTAVMKGTLRTFDDQLAEKLIRRITEMSQSIAQAYRVEAEVKTLYQGPVLICADEMNELALSCVKGLGLDGMVWDKLKGTGSEDFAYIAQKVPSTYFTIGASVGNPEEWISQHNPKVRFNEEILYKAVAIYSTVALTWLEKQAS